LAGAQPTTARRWPARTVLWNSLPVILTLCVLAACAPASLQLPAATLPPNPGPQPSLTATLIQAVAPSITPVPPTAAPTLTPSATSTALPPSPTPGPRLCSPLAEVTLPELPGLVAGNPYQLPSPGRDDGHPGVDFAFYTHGSRKSILGLPVLAAMAGRVAAVIPDRKPYGNTVIIEVPLETLPQRWQSTLNLPTPAPAVIPDARLTCPFPLQLPPWDLSKRSMYILYAHLNQPSPLHVGDAVTCAQPLGEVGTTGASVNPHLHFETRLGPAATTLASFGHYDLHTTAAERNNYCLWRVSGWFQLVDPLKILAQQP